MKVNHKSLFLAPLFILLFSLSFAQKWMEEPFFKPSPEQARDQVYNFYDLQKAFQAFEKDYWAQETERCEGEDKPKFKGYNGFKRWEWFNEPRVYPTGEFPRVDMVLAEYEQFALRKAQDNAGNASGKTASANWVNLTSPNAPVGQLSGMGRINCMAFQPGNTNILYIGAACGGVWKSMDAGQTWNVLNTDQLPSLSITSIVIDPSNPNNIYLATGDNYTGFVITGVLKQGHYSAGIFKSTDAGLTWNVVGMPSIQSQQFIPQQLIMDPVTPNVMLLAANTGIWRSIDGGVNWTLRQANFFYSIEFNPQNHNVAYATDGLGLWRSNNNGVTWTYKGGGYPNSSQAGRVTLAVTPADTNYIYLWGPPSVFKRSVNGGTSFVTMGSPDAIAQPYGYVDRAIGVSRTNALEVFVGGMTSAKSINGGTSWAASSVWNNAAVPNYVHPDVKRLVYEPGGTKIYMLNDAGISVSANGGTTWVDISNGLQIAEIYKIASHPVSPDTILFGAQDNGTNRRSGPTGSLLQLDAGDGFQPVYHPTNPRTMYVIAQLGAVKKSIDGGANFVSASPGQMLWNPPLKMNPLNPNTMYAGCVGGFKKSYAAGLQGSYVNLSAGTLDQIRSMGITKADTNRIYTANMSDIITSTNGGTTWSLITAGVPTNLAAISYIDVSTSDPNRVYVCLSGYSAGNKVFMSTDGGTTWSNYSGLSLPNVPVNCITYVEGSNDAVYIGTDFGVFFRDAAAADWTSFNTGLPNVVVNHLQVFYPTMKLRAGTYGRGIWETDMVLSLPVGLQGFSADCRNDNVEIAWTTSSELGSEDFTVERASDGRNFQAIGKVRAAGNSDQPIDYFFKDSTPIWGVATYRLKQTDVDGRVLYSKVLTAGCNNQLGIEVYPNPNNGRFTVRGETALSMVEIRNVLGELVHRADIGANEVVIDLSLAAKGVYFYKAESALGGSKSGKIIVR